MTELRQEVYTMPAASMGRDNPLPNISTQEDQHAAARIDRNSISEEESRYMGWGRVRGILPYTMRDGYNRNKKPRNFDAFVLENKHLRAIFLPELGGRLWSLTDLHTGRELLHKNPVFQPCNLALRNAWISGGVEWNVGIIGHTPYTLDPLFVRTKTLMNGTPGLSMYQYERVRGLCYRVEAMLPDDSRFLLVRVRIDNCTPKDTAVYWWSNIAVDERPDVRVIVPAEKAFHFGPDAHVSKVEIPLWENVDTSHPANIPYAMDFFYDIKHGQRRFITALDEKGYGLVQCSTDTLRGRKLFVWGQGKGGKRWQRFLSQEGSSYIEIQAGLARTQLEHLPMAASATISWMEAYGALTTDPSKSQGADYRLAVGEAESRLESALPRRQLEEAELACRRELDDPRGWSQLRLAEGWAALEKRLLGNGFDVVGLQFPAASLRAAQKPWLQLIKQGYLPKPDLALPPRSYQTGKDWREALQHSIDHHPQAMHWFSFYHLGVMEAFAGNIKGAQAAFQKSLKLQPSAWAYWCLAILREQQGDLDAAADLSLDALDLLPHRALAIETLRLLHKARRDRELIVRYDLLPPRLRALGRCKALLAAACLQTGDLARARKLLQSRLELADIREGEVSLSTLWFELCARELAEQRGIHYSDELLSEAKRLSQPPEHLDFRMKE